MLLVSSMAVTAALKPYTKSARWIAILDAAGHFVLITCLLCGVTWFGVDSGPSSEGAAFANILVVVLVLTFGLLLFGLVFHHVEKRWMLKYCCCCCCKQSAKEEPEEVEMTDNVAAAVVDQEARASAAAVSDIEQSHQRGESASAEADIDPHNLDVDTLRPKESGPF